LESNCIVKNKQSLSQAGFISKNVMDGEFAVEYDEEYKMEPISNHHISY